MAVTLAVLVKIRASKTMSKGAVIVTAFVALGSALVFTRPVLHWLELDCETYTAGVAALVALTSEHVMRQLLDIKLTDLVRGWKPK